MDDSDTYKKSTAVREQVQQYGRDGFQPGIIKAVLVDKARSHEESQATGMNKVTTKDVCNWLRTVKPDASTDFGCTQSKAPLTELMLHMDVADARLFLTNTGYKQEFIRCPIGKDGKSRWVLVFVNKEQLENLGKLGHAFQFDGAACMNKWEAIMSSIMVQSSSGTWIPVGHLVVSEECGDTVKAGVAQLKQWCPSWKHHYCLIDDSSRERKRVESSSGGPTDLCTVHSRRTMMKRLGTQRTSIDFLNLQPRPGTTWPEQATRSPGNCPSC